MEAKNKDVLIKISYETRKKLKVEASKKDTTIKEFVNFLVNRHIENK